MNFSELVGKTLKSVNVEEYEILFETIDGEKYRMCHYQDCCEFVYVEDICGDITDILGSPVLVAEEVIHSGYGDKPSDGYNNPHAAPQGWEPAGEYSESWTWTFYKIDTAKGGITIRWCGGSNGYYSESVYFDKEEQ